MCQRTQNVWSSTLSVQIIGNHGLLSKWQRQGAMRHRFAKLNIRIICRKPRRVSFGLPNISRQGYPHLQKVGKVHERFPRKLLTLSLNSSVRFLKWIQKRITGSILLYICATTSTTYCVAHKYIISCRIEWGRKRLYLPLLQHIYFIGFFILIQTIWLQRYLMPRRAVSLSSSAAFRRARKQRFDYTVGLRP